MSRARWCVALVIGLGSAAWATERLSRAEALALAFPGATIERREHFLTEEQVAKVKALSGVGVRSKYVVAYEARSGQVLTGIAFFDTHQVRTQPETAMVAISPQGTIVRVEVVQFGEPQEYAAPARWVQQLSGKELSPRLSLKVDVKPLSGASLTAQSLVDASRRALALFAVLSAPSER